MPLQHLQRILLYLLLEQLTLLREGGTARIALVLLG